jgi:hypothetical protein
VSGLGREERLEARHVADGWRVIDIRNGQPVIVVDIALVRLSESAAAKWTDQLNRFEHSDFTGPTLKGQSPIRGLSAIQALTPAQALNRTSGRPRVTGAHLRIIKDGGSIPL